ncbi:MAG: elongation factor G [Spirochaetes bacterium]|nr:elongation factor G [Spirochaetota bacterium]
MADITTENIRNIALIGHNGTGKTSLADALLYEAKAVSRLGKVDDGSSVFDYTEEEIERKISISNSLAQFMYNSKKINLVDTPGYTDFIGEPIAALRGVDIIVDVIDAAMGIQFTSLKLLKEAQKHNLSKILFINKMDKENADYDQALNKIKDVIKTGVMPLTIPIREGKEIKGVINVFENKAYYINGDKVETKEIPENLKGTADEYRLKMVEAIAETKDSLMEKYFEQGSISEEEISSGLKQGVLNGTITPVFSGVANRDIGVHSLLNFIEISSPSPADRIPVKAFKADGKTEVECKADSSAPVKAFIFKTEAESHVGELNFVRVFSGTINYGEEYYNTNKDVSEKIGQINSIVGKDKKEIKKLIAGDIGVLLKLKKTHIGNTLCSASDKVKFPDIEFPYPLLDIAIKAKTKADEDKLSSSLHKMLEADPTIKINVDSELKQTIISGMGEVQINIFLNNLKNKYGVNVITEDTKIPYRETIKKASEAQGKYKKQTGGRGQYGDCWLKIEPLTTTNGSEDFEFVNKIVGGSIPGKYIPSIEKGVRETLLKGFLAGYPIIKVKATVFDGSYHNVDSSDIAFQIAGSMAFKIAAESAKAVLLEPIMRIKVYSPDKYMGDIMSDLNSRRGKILGMEDQAGLKIINAHVPQSEMNKYINELKSITQGSGTYESAFDHYSEVPHDVSQKIIELAKKEKEEA